MSLASSVDLREFRSGGGDRRQNNDYAYADPMEEMDRGPRPGPRSHRTHRDPKPIPGRGYPQPMLHPPSSSHHYPQGPIITTPSMEMSLSRHPVRHQPRSLPYHPEPYPPYHHTNGVAYPPQPLGGGQSSDLLVMLAAVCMVICCPLSLICTVPACFCLLQGQQFDNEGRPAEAAMRRNYSLGLLCCGGVLGLLLELVVAAVVIIFYYSN